MYLVWAVGAAMIAVAIEFAARSGVNWLHNLWWIAPASLAINFFIFRLLQTDFGWLPSIVLFGATTAMLRILLAAVVLHEPTTTANIASAVVLIAGVGIKLVWR